MVIVVCFSALLLQKMMIRPSLAHPKAYITLSECGADYNYWSAKPENDCNILPIKSDARWG